MKNIKIITFENFPYGGASANLLRYFALSLSKEKNQVEILLPTGYLFGNNKNTSIKRKSKIECISYKYLTFTTHPKNFILKIISIIIGCLYTPIYLLYLNLFKKIDIIICYNMYFTKYILILAFNFFYKTKIIFIIPEFYEKPKKNIISTIKWYDFYIGMKFITKKADGIIPVSNYLKNYFLNDLKLKKPIFVLPSLIDPEIYNNIVVKPFLKNIITIGYSGTPTKKDGIKDLILSFSILNKKYSNTHLVIIGDSVGRKSVIEDLKQYSKELNILDKITFTGLISHDMVPTFLKSCQILALTRPPGIVAEAGFPTKIAEYFACKIPVLATNVGDIPFYFTNKKELYIAEAGNIDSIVNGFTYIINNEEISKSLVNNAYEWVNNNISYCKKSKEISEFIINI